MKHTKCYIPGYPRPQLVRGDWEDLDGEWKFAFGEEVSESAALAGDLPRTIRVPFSYETPMSGIGDPAPHSVVWYSRLVAGKRGKRALLHFEGADYDTEVYVNGKKAGDHRGAYSRFTLDVTSFLTKKENILTVRCTDENHPAQVRGKQRWEKENFGCWYVQTTGIYKSVWLEFVAETYLDTLKITPETARNAVRFDFSVNAPADDAEVRFDISFDGKRICSASASAAEKTGSVSVGLNSANLTYQVELWSPDHPALYDVDITVFKGGKPADKAGSYFGLRDFVAKDGKLVLNDVPFYARLLLDQGYWKESGITPPSEEAMIEDIRLSREMGFNGVRKHQKVEDERFFYYADIMGFVVWCELPSNHWFSDDCICEISREWLDIVRQNYNHPSLVTWVVFNESWGVRRICTDRAESNLASGLYYLTKAIDPMRPVVSNDGWVHTESDILTLHHYEQDPATFARLYDTKEKLVAGSADNSQYPPFAEGYSYRGQPIVFSEFGGTAYVRDEDSGWGYGNGVKSDEEFLERFGGLIRAIGDMRISGYCYTQLTDVEQEVNGLLRADRTPKVPTEEIRKRNS